MKHPLEHRKAERKPVAMAAKCRTSGGTRDQGLLSNLSTHGCCVTTRSLHMNVGMRVVIKPQGLEGLSGVVRWIDGNRAGVEFDQPLYLPVADFLTAHHSLSRRVSVSCLPT